MPPSSLASPQRSAAPIYKCPACAAITMMRTCPSCSTSTAPATMVSTSQVMNGAASMISSHNGSVAPSEQSRASLNNPSRPSAAPSLQQHQQYDRSSSRTSAYQHQQQPLSPSQPMRPTAADLQQQRTDYNRTPSSSTSQVRAALQGGGGAGVGVGGYGDTSTLLYADNRTAKGPRGGSNASFANTDPRNDNGGGGGDDSRVYRPHTSGPTPHSSLSSAAPTAATMEQPSKLPSSTSLPQQQQQYRVGGGGGGGGIGLLGFDDGGVRPLPSIPRGPTATASNTTAGGVGDTHAPSIRGRVNKVPRYDQHGNTEGQQQLQQERTPSRQRYSSVADDGYPQRPPPPEASQQDGGQNQSSTADYNQGNGLNENNSNGGGGVDSETMRLRSEVDRLSHALRLRDEELGLLQKESAHIAATSKGGIPMVIANPSNQNENKHNTTTNTTTNVPSLNSPNVKMTQSTALALVGGGGAATTTVSNAVSAATLMEMQDLWRTIHYQQDDMSRATEELKIEYERLNAEHALAVGDRDRLTQECRLLRSNKQQSEDKYEAELQKMRDELRQLSVRLVQQSDAVVAAKGQSDQLGSRNAALEAQLAESRAEAQQLHADLKAVTVAMDALQHQVSGDRVAAEEKIQQLSKQNAELEACLSTLEVDRDNFQNALEKSEEREHTLEELLSKAGNALAEQKGKAAAEAKETEEEFMLQLRRVMASLKETEEQRAALTAQNEELAKALAEVKASLEASQTEAREQKAKATREAESNAQLRADCEDVSARLVTAKRRLVDAESDHHTAEEQLVEARAKIKELLQQQFNMSANAEEDARLARQQFDQLREDEMAPLRANITALRSELTDKEMRLSALQTEMFEKERQFAQEKAAVERAQAEKDETYRKNIAELEQSLAESKERFLTVQSAKDDLLKSIADQQEEHNTSIGFYEMSLGSARQAVSTLESEKAALQKTLADKNAQCADAHAAVEALQTMKASLLQEMAENEAESAAERAAHEKRVAAYEAQVATYMAKVAEMEGVLSELQKAVQPAVSGLPSSVAPSPARVRSAIGGGSPMSSKSTADTDGAVDFNFNANDQSTNTSPVRKLSAGVGSFSVQPNRSAAAATSTTDLASLRGGGLAAPDTHYLPLVVDDIVIELGRLREKAMRDDEEVGALRSSLEEAQHGMSTIEGRMRDMMTDLSARVAREEHFTTRLAEVEAIAKQLNDESVALQELLVKEEKRHADTRRERDAFEAKCLDFAAEIDRLLLEEAERARKIPTTAQRGCSPFIRPAMERASSPFRTAANERGNSPMHTAPRFERGNSPMQRSVANVGSVTSARPSPTRHERGVSPFRSTSTATVGTTTRSITAVSVGVGRGDSPMSSPRTIGTSPFRTNSPARPPAGAFESTLEENEALKAESDVLREELAELRAVAQQRIADLHDLLAVERNEKAVLVAQLDTLQQTYETEHSAHEELKALVDKLGANPQRSTSLLELSSASEAAVFEEHRRRWAEEKYALEEAITARDHRIVELRAVLQLHGIEEGEAPNTMTTPLQRNGAAAVTAVPRNGDASFPQNNGGNYGNYRSSSRSQSAMRGDRGGVASDSQSNVPFTTSSSSTSTPLPPQPTSDGALQQQQHLYRDPHDVANVPSSALREENERLAAELQRFRQQQQQQQQQYPVSGGANGSGGEVYRMSTPLSQHSGSGHAAAGGAPSSTASAKNRHRSWF